jgi:hypothetical protein
LAGLAGGGEEQPAVVLQEAHPVAHVVSVILAQLLGEAEAGAQKSSSHLGDIS